MDRNSYSDLSDQELIASYQLNGDNQYMAILYKRYVSLVFGLCYKYFNNQHEAEDATSHIFQILLDKLKDNSITYFKSWLYVVSKNYILLHIRKNKTHQFQYVEEFSDNIMENDSDTHLNITENGIDSERILKLGLESLKEAQQICVELFYLQSKSYVQIAEITDFDIKQVKSHIQNGKRNLKIFLESKGYRYEQK
ncbi:MAG: sigma-70 family RNA polymerase sigma factor [Chitinophagales bacterium]|nr:sigma-70 family RNA polymerase sigma factor [Chitinophagales bacterium]MCZ2393815.1 sigma-70 family RNA polymerase sigma factor [Chitinophagales bacterium]